MKYKIAIYRKLNIQIDEAESGLALLIGYTIDCSTVLYCTHFLQGGTL
jgi:hypothetical protein